MLDELISVSTFLIDRRERETSIAFIMTQSPPNKEVFTTFSTF